MPSPFLTASGQEFGQRHTASRRGREQRTGAWPCCSPTSFSILLGFKAHAHTCLAWLSSCLGWDSTLQAVSDPAPLTAGPRGRPSRVSCTTPVLALRVCTQWGLLYSGLESQDGFFCVRMCHDFSDGRMSGAIDVHCVARPCGSPVWLSTCLSQGGSGCACLTALPGGSVLPHFSGVVGGRLVSAIGCYRCCGCERPRACFLEPMC